MRRIWVTRAQPGADEAAARVRTLGLEALVEPLLEVRAVGEGRPDLAGVAALAFTSANAVRAFAGRSPDRSLRVFAVGAATAGAARAAGFTDIASADGDVAALGHLIAGEGAGLDGAVLHPSAAEPAGDLVGALAAAGVQVMSLTLYETVALCPGPAATEAIVQGAVALVHSPRGAGALRAFIGDSPAPGLTALCLSPAVAAALAHAAVAAVRAAATPDEDALLALLADEVARD